MPYGRRTTWISAGTALPNRAAPMLWAVLYMLTAHLAPGSFSRAAAESPQAERGLRFLDDLHKPLEQMRDPYEERIETERHDFTQSTKTVGRGVAQVEAGYSYFYRDDDSAIEHAHTTPEMMLRLGITEDIEFRLRWDYAWRFADGEESVHGSEDLRWAFKLGMTEQESWRPESALEVRFTAPTGGAAWSTKRAEFGLDYIYGWEVAPGWTLYGSSGFATGALGDFGFLPEDPADETFIAWTQSTALGIELGERSTLYTEWFGVFSDGLENEFTANFFNLGLDYYVSHNFVLDLRVGLGLSDDADDFFAGAGGGYRF